ncbi:hypothetical protein Poli38472_007476 [Pythium oligandrum]|uniref:Uncharacterized protein n=1 Tax=Pythium oligandrum TaxID=41045 RepID=A0A8K1CR98_PYTOL|nr:hypothetical protein Poli38472_007476 [Pythium oligandrum]|eukprot:TMW67804.1 hypothetical protein Poli38472_007476 [Pythium oligandrum]
MVIRGVAPPAGAKPHTVLAPVQAPADPSASEDFFHLLSTLDGDFVLGELRADAAAFSLTFGERRVAPGAYIPVIQAGNAPTVQATQDGVFTWVLLDIDATNAPFLHAITSNIQSGTTDNQVAVVSYFPVLPSSGAHRYVSLLFKQQEVAPRDHFSGHEEEFQARRPTFDVSAYAQREQLDFVAYSYFYSTPAQPTEL